MADGIVMRRADAARIPEELALLGVSVEPYRRTLGAESAHLCTREDASAILAIDQPNHWKEASDVRRDLVVVALQRTGLFLRGDDKRLHEDVRQRLVQFEWRPADNA